MRIICTLLLLLITTTSQAHYNCSRSNKKRAASKTTIATLEEIDYDVKGLKFDIELTNTSTAISGHVTTYARTLISSFQVYAFELDTALVIDSFKLNGQMLAVQTTGEKIRKVNLLAALGSNVDFIAEVYYHGQPKAGSGQFFTGGLNQVKVGNNDVMYSLSDPDFADDWWPCKQALTDKIDSVIMWVTVDNGLRAGSNGVLKQVTSLGGGKQRFEWETNYPIEYYLISVAVGPYADYSYYMHYTDGSNDSMLIQNYVLDSANFMNAANKAALDTTGLIVDHFSKLYSRYPFSNEKYGHCMSALTGGMEHQTMTTLGYATPTLIAHELGHQWWGDNVTYGMWEDIWLSEGMATYGEQLFVEHFRGVQSAKNLRSSVFGHVLSSPSGSVWVDDTTNVNRIFDGRLTYSKGAAVAHMLRYMAPQDSLFFKGLQVFQNQYAYGNAVTEDLKNIMEQTYNMQLDTFFRQWIYGQGYPTISVSWFQSGTEVHVKVKQIPSHNSVKAFEIPVEIKIKSATSDTLVRVDMTDTAQHFIFYWADNMTGVEIDPDDNILNKGGLTVKDPTLLGVKSEQFPQINVYPNPATDGWQLQNIPAGSSLKLYDMAGKLIWQSESEDNSFVPAGQLPKGTYMLQVVNTRDINGHYKLIK